MPRDITITGLVPGNNGSLDVRVGDTVHFYSDVELGELRDGEYFQAFTGDLFSQQGPSLTDIKQTDFGNCLLLAIVQGIILSQPDRISRLLRVVESERNEYVCVRLYSYDASEWKYIAVEKTMMKARLISLHDGTQHTAAWVHMIEKAYVAMIKRTTNAEVNLSYKRAICFGQRNPESIATILLGNRTVSTEYILPEKICYPLSRSDVNREPRQPHASAKPYHDLALLISGSPTQKASVWPRFFPTEGQQIDEVTLNSLRSKLKKTFTRSFLLYDKYYETLRRNKVLDILGVNEWAETEQNPVFTAVRNYLEEHLPYKRGEATGAGMLRPYIANHDYYYNCIVANLSDTAADNHRRKMIMLITDKVLTKRYNIFFERGARGIVSSHAYTVLNAYERAGRKMLLLRNPHGEYTRGYTQKHKGDVQVLSASSRATAMPGNIEQISRDYSNHPADLERQRDYIIREHLSIPGVFELELSDLTKRFDYIFTVDVE